jgi:hypothetical protein
MVRLPAQRSVADAWARLEAAVAAIVADWN